MATKFFRQESEQAHEQTEGTGSFKAPQNFMKPSFDLRDKFLLLKQVTTDNDTLGGLPQLSNDPYTYRPFLRTNPLQGLGEL